MRDVCWWSKDGDMVCCGVRCGYECMGFPVQRSALEQMSECVGRGAKYLKDRMHVGIGKKREANA